MTKCFGCGRDLDHGHDFNYGTADLAGESRSFCGRNYQYNKGCFMKALKRLHDDGLCVICGEQNDYYAPSGPCHRCRDKLTFAEKYQHEPARIQQDAMEKLAYGLANYSRYGKEPGQLRDRWPVILLKDCNEELSRALLTCLRDLWELDVSQSQEKGFQEGADLLRGLKAGTIGLSNFQEKVEKSHNRWSDYEKDRRGKIQELLAMALKLKSTEARDDL